MLSSLPERSVGYHNVRDARCASGGQLPVALLRVAPVLLLGLLYAAPGMAALNDTLQPFVGTSYAYDSNLFRVSDNNPQRDADTIKSVVAGVALERALGRQVFTGSAKISRVTFSKYDELNYNGKDADLTWRWQLGNHLDGTAGLTYSETLSSFSDFHTTQRNLRVARGNFFDGGWRLHPRWRVRGRVSRDTYEYDLAAQQYLDRTEDRGEVGFDYLVPSGSSIGLQARRTKGTYPNPLSYAGVVDNEGYRQTDLQVKVAWIYSAITQVQFIGGRARRSHNVLAQRDSSGVNGRLDAHWLPRASLQFTLSGWREFQPFEGSVASYSMSKGVSLNASWAATAKIQVQGNVRHARRNFDGQLLAPTVSGGGDSTKSATLGVTYSPLPKLQISANVTNDARSSDSVFSTQYRARGALLSANFQF
jgi:exopolysaccharide biosynthesis operon protein EpsL